MQVILIEDVKSLGKKGTIVNVTDSYARNYIIPRKLGVEANKVNMNNLKLKNANEEKLEAAKVANANDMKRTLDGKKLVIKVKAGKDGKLFGAVTAKEVAEAIDRDFKVDIDKKKIVMENFKSTGDYEINIKLHKGINAAMNVTIEEA